MPKPHDTYLSKREQQIMEVLYAGDGHTANEVVAALPDQPTNATVRSLLRILEEKGVVTHEVVSGKFIYRPAVSRETEGKGALSRLVHTFFRGSIKDAVASLVDERDQPLTEQEIQELQDLIDRARK